MSTDDSFLQNLSARPELLRFRELYGCSPHLVGLLDRQGRLLEANPSALRQVDKDIEEIRGQAYWETPWWSDDPLAQATLKRAVERAACGETVRFETTQRSRQGVQHLDFSITPLQGSGGEVDFLLPEGRDITPQKRSLAELEDQRAALEALVEERSRELEDAKAKLLATQERLLAVAKISALGEMMATVSHEVNTPLGIALTAVAICQKTASRLKASREAGDLTNQEFDEALAGLLQSGSLAENALSRAKTLLGSFRRLSVDQITEETRCFQLKEYLEEICLGLGALIKRGGHQIELDCPPGLMVQSFPGALSQVVSNLVINSVNHGFGQTQHGCIRIAVQRLGEGIRIDYRDDGKGIPAELRERIFEPFFTTNREGGNSGLGMSIVHNLVSTLFHGAIELCDHPQRGVWFRIDLAMQIADAPQEFCE